ncbi:MAG TPA: hypothetical protein VHD83_00460 [Puia sp.]|nr:hypothetical protein [Puia sp.]
MAERGMTGAGYDRGGQRRISSWRERRAPEGYAFPGDPRKREQTRYGTAELSSPGRKLPGLDRW